jgi:cytochrome c5
MKSMRNLTIGFLAVATVLGAASAASGEKEATGQELYKEHCKSCHTKGSKNGEYTPMTLIQEQWERFFDKKFVPSHQSAVDEKHGGKKVPEVISPDMLKKIRKFAVDHAADSESPATCG